VSGGLANMPAERSDLLTLSRQQNWPGDSGAISKEQGNFSMLATPAGVGPTSCLNSRLVLEKNTDGSQAAQHDTKPFFRDLTNGMAGFETRYEEAQRRKREAKRNDQHKGEFNDFALAASEQKNLVRKRLEDGYELPFAKEIGGRFRQPFRERGLRSEGNLVLKYFVTLVPKGGKARASDDKATLAVQCTSKLLTLDYPYIEVNREFLSTLRVDCDGVFRTPEACLFALTEAVRDGRIPCLPHIVVGDQLDDGRYARPHFLWLLPPGATVWRSNDERCRAAPIRLFDAVARGLAGALIDMGADPAAPATTGRMKCPTSPIWFTITPNSDVWPTLTDYADYVDTSVSRAVLARKAAAAQSGLGLTASNKLFDAIRTEGQRLLAHWHFGVDERMRGSKATLADHLHETLAIFAADSGLGDERLSFVTGKVSDYLAHHFDASKLDRRGVNRGKLLDVVDGLKTVTERQSAGGRYAGKAKGVSTFEKLLAAYRHLQQTGASITQTSLAEKCGISRRTVVKRWGEIVDTAESNVRGCENSCIDKKEGAAPVGTDEITSRVLGSTSLVGAEISEPDNYLEAVKTMIEKIMPGRWVSNEEMAAFRPRMAA
jgi:hypothetical protein